MKLHELKASAGARKAVTRKGRGAGSGNGKTAGFRPKGQKARSGVKKAGFEGGQMPMQRRLPKRGFNNIFATKYVTIKVSDLEKFEAGATVDTEALLKAGIISKTLDGFFAVRPSRDTASGSMPQISFAILHPSCGFLHYNRRRRKKPEKSQSKGGVYRTVKSFLCRQGRGASGTLDVLLCFDSLNLCLLPKNWSVRLQFQKKCLFCCRKIV